MSLVVQASGMKGAMSRVIKARVDGHLAEVGDLLTPEQRACIEALRAAANALVVRTPRGKHIDVQLLLADAPFGGMQMTVSVTASRPPSR